MLVRLGGGSEACDSLPVLEGKQEIGWLYSSDSDRTRVKCLN